MTLTIQDPNAEKLFNSVRLGNLSQLCQLKSCHRDGKVRQKCYFKHFNKIPSLMTGRFFGQPACWSCCEASTDTGLGRFCNPNNNGDILKPLKTTIFALDPKHILNITINRQVVEEVILWNLRAICAADLWGCTTYRCWYESICRVASQWWITLSNWPTSSPAASVSTPGGQRKITAATEHTQPPCL